MAVITSASFKPLHCFAWSFCGSNQSSAQLACFGGGQKRRRRLFRKPKALVMISVSRYFTHLLQGTAKRKATWIKAGGVGCLIKKSGSLSVVAFFFLFCCWPSRFYFLAPFVLVKRFITDTKKKTQLITTSSSS